MRVLLSGNIRKRSILALSARRHLASLARHMTVRRFANASLCVAEMWMKRSRLHSHPFYLRVDVSDACNLRCPGCIAGQRPARQPREKAGFMSFELFESAVRPFLPYLLKVNLYDQGEPLLNPDLFRMIALLSRRNISTCISTNFSLPLSDAQLERLVASGLEHLIVALDGLTQETYVQYRRGGNLSLVLSNLKRIIAIKRDRKSALPLIDVQFIEFDHNLHQKDVAAQLAYELGADRFTVIQGSSVDGWKGTDFQGSEEERRRLGCYQAWVAAQIDSDGSLKLCDYGSDHGMLGLGMAADYTTSALRNATVAVQIRRSFSRAGIGLSQWCKTCSLYRDAAKSPASVPPRSTEELLPASPVLTIDPAATEETD